MKLLLSLFLLSSISFSKSLVDILNGDSLTVKKGVEIHTDTDGDIWTTPCHIRILNYNSEEELKNVSIESLKGAGRSLAFNTEEGFEFSNVMTDISDYYTRIRTVKTGQQIFDPIYQIKMEILDGNLDNQYLEVNISKLTLGGLFNSNWKCRVLL